MIPTILAYEKAKMDYDSAVDAYSKQVWFVNSLEVGSNQYYSEVRNLNRLDNLFGLRRKEKDKAYNAWLHYLGVNELAQHCDTYIQSPIAKSVKQLRPEAYLGMLQHVFENNCVVSIVKDANAFKVIITPEVGLYFITPQHARDFVEGIGLVMPN